jgi:hypothetical protein
LVVENKVQMLMKIMIVQIISFQLQDNDDLPKFSFACITTKGVLVRQMISLDLE